jgi:hypothetical protein
MTFTKIGPWLNASASPTPTWTCWNGSLCTTNRPSSSRSASSFAYRILEKDRSHENSHPLLTEAYALLGSYGRALHQYRLFKGVLKSVHGTEPSVETEER